MRSSPIARTVSDSRSGNAPDVAARHGPMLHRPAHDALWFLSRPRHDPTHVLISQASIYEIGHRPRGGRDRLRCDQSCRDAVDALRQCGRHRLRWRPTSTASSSGQPYLSNGSPERQAGEAGPFSQPRPPLDSRSQSGLQTAIPYPTNGKSCCLYARGTCSSSSRCSSCRNHPLPRNSAASRIRHLGKPGHRGN